VSVSVVITTYNDAQYLERSIRSVLEQTSPPEDIIVVDDGSHDNLAQEIAEREFREHRDILRFFRKPNGGPSSARNFGLSKCRSEFIAFLDADDYWLPENLVRKLGMSRSCHSNYFGVYGSFIDSETNKVARFLSTDCTPLVEKIGCANGFPGGAPAYLFRCDALRSVHGFDESLSFNEDLDLILRLIKADMHCKGDSHPGFYRDRRVGSLTRGLNPERKYKGVRDFLCKVEKSELLPPEEIRSRRKLNALVFAKGLRAMNAPAERIKEALIEGFSYERPSGLRECLAFVYMKCL
jgi:glycosyltransferase involved in cell wall biosynthesis